jgi:Ca2+-binding RTX toxin-like protein
MRYRRMRRRRPRPGVLTVLTLVAFVVIGLTASNMVASSHAADRTQAITANTLKPVECNGITLTTVVVGTNGTAGADLLVGSGAGQTMSGNGGNDCILGGGGNDTLRGNAGTDVCIGGPGADSFAATCEIRYQ